jgi:hypothetical protein
MTRKEYLEKSLQLGMCSCAYLFTGMHQDATGTMPPKKCNDELEQLRAEKKFIENWLTDLLGTMEKELDHDTLVRMYEGCGRGCFNRHQFKQNIAIFGKGDIDRLIEGYQLNFEIWRDGNTVHIRYGEKSDRCYCPAAQFKPAQPNDLHCECTRSTHQTIFETAIGRPFRVEILETLRRGGQTCHFLVHLT